MLCFTSFYAQLENQSSRPHALASDPRRLRRWLREMETDMAKSPTLSAAMKMKPAELRKRLKEHSVSGRTISYILFYVSLLSYEEEKKKKNILPYKLYVSALSHLNYFIADRNNVITTFL